MTILEHVNESLKVAFIIAMMAEKYAHNPNLVWILFKIPTKLYTYTFSQFTTKALFALWNINFLPVGIQVCILSLYAVDI